MFARALKITSCIAACLLVSASAEEEAFGLEVDDDQTRIFSREFMAELEEGVDPCDKEYQKDLRQAISDHNAQSDDVIVDFIDFNCDMDGRRKLQGRPCVPSPGAPCPGNTGGSCPICPPSPPFCDDVHNSKCWTGSRANQVGTAISNILNSAQAPNYDVRVRRGRRALSIYNFGVLKFDLVPATLDDVAVAIAVNANVTIDTIDDKIKNNLAWDDDDDIKANDIRKAIRKLKKSLKADIVANKDEILNKIEELKVKLQGVIAERDLLRKSRKDLKKRLRKAEKAKDKATAILAGNPGAKARIAKLKAIQADAVAKAKAAAAAKGPL